MFRPRTPRDAGRLSPRRGSQETYGGADAKSTRRCPYKPAGRAGGGGEATRRGLRTPRARGGYPRKCCRKRYPDSEAGSRKRPGRWPGAGVGVGTEDVAPRGRMRRRVGRTRMCEGQRGGQGGMESREAVRAPGAAGQGWGGGSGSGDEAG